jgi:hypothetical protein
MSLDATSTLSPFRCLGCKRTLGYTDGRLLSADPCGPTMAPEIAVLRCTCGRKRTWRAVEPGRLDLPVSPASR